MMTTSLSSPSSFLSVIPATSLKSVNHVVFGRNQSLRTTTRCTSSTNNNNNNCQSKSIFFNPSDDILNKAFKEPVAFMGGMFAGLLRLDLNEDPLKEWVTRTVEASGYTDDENVTPEEQLPQQIEID